MAKREGIMSFEREEQNSENEKRYLFVEGRDERNCPTLTQREAEVLHLMADGKSNIQIAEMLVISEHTAKAHVCNILEKFDVHDRILAVVKAMRLGLLD